MINKQTRRTFLKACGLTIAGLSIGPCSKIAVAERCIEQAGSYSRVSENTVDFLQERPIIRFVIYTKLAIRVYLEQSDTPDFKVRMLSNIVERPVAPYDASMFYVVKRQFVRLRYESDRPSEGLILAWSQADADGYAGRMTGLMTQLDSMKSTH